MQCFGRTPAHLGGTARSLPVVAALVLLAAFVLVACSGPGGDRSGAGTGTGPESGGATPAAATEQPAPTEAPAPASAAGETPVLADAAPRGEEAVVLRVVDGDTAEVAFPDGRRATVRYIGIDTPETSHPTVGRECFGEEAKARHRDLVEGRTVRLERDVSETDRYGRLLRYVWLEEALVNETLVRDGYAVVATYPPDVRYAERFRAAEREARAAGRGLWGACGGADTPAGQPPPATAAPRELPSPGAGSP